MRILMYGSEHTAPATRVCDWVVRAGHEVVWAGYLGEVAGHTGAHHVQIKSNDNPAPELADIVSKFRPHLAHAHNCNFLGAVHLKQRFGPIILSAFGSLNPIVDGEAQLNPMVEHMLEANPPLIVESAVLFDAVSEKFPDVPCELISLGVKPRHYRKVTPAQRAAWRKTLGIPQDACVFFSVRGIGDCYNQDQILDAFARARPNLPKGSILALIKLTRTWDRREMVDALAMQAAELRISDHLHWLPEVRHEMMPGMFGIADFVINFPREDAFPSSLVEAAACELPIISAHLPAYAGSYIETFARLVEPGCTKALTRAMIDAASEPDAERRENASCARRHIVAHFQESNQRDKLLALYERVAGHAAG